MLRTDLTNSASTGHFSVGKDWLLSSASNLVSIVVSAFLLIVYVLCLLGVLCSGATRTVAMRYHSHLCWAIRTFPHMFSILLYNLTSQTLLMNRAISQCAPRVSRSE